MSERRFRRHGVRQIPREIDGDRILRLYGGDGVTLRKNWLAFVLTVGLGLVLSGCGEPGVTQVVRQLQTVQSQLTSYRTTAMMTVQVQGAPERYYVETWYQAPNQYRIALGNENREISQIILRNDRGIYILSPGNKKMIRFQGDWAERQGQLYLYNAMLSRIVAASEPTYSAREKMITFEMSGDSINPMISTQKVELAEGSFAPVQVVLYDKQKQPLITMNYISFQKGVTFPADAFSTEQSTTLQPIEVPVSAQEQGFGMIEPTFLPGGDVLRDESDRDGIVMVRYGGSDPFTLIETRVAAAGLDLGSGQLLTVGGVPAVMLDDGGLRQLYWVHNGVEFQITTRMSEADILQVAGSTLSDLGKS